MQSGAQTGSGGPPSLAEALQRLWGRFQPEIEARVAIVESAASAAGTLSRAQQEGAHAAAHKLAGVLGTFGLAEGTALARELEHLLDPEGAPNASEAERIVSLTVRLRAIVNNRK